MAIKAQKQYQIVKAESFNNNRHGGPTYWVVYIDGDTAKPSVFETLDRACAWISKFSEPALPTAA